MTATNHTEHYDLSQYTENDHPTYTGDYNGDMAKIDTAIYAASQSCGIATVTHTDDLTGDGTGGSPLGVADTIARNESVTQAIAAAIADRLTSGDIQAGDGINVSVSGNTVTISYEGGNSAVAHDNTLTGDGTSGKPLGVVAGTAIKPVDNRWNPIDFNDYCINGIYTFNGPLTNGPRNQWTSGVLIVLRSYETLIQLCITQPYIPPNSMSIRVAATNSDKEVPAPEAWSGWKFFAYIDNATNVSALTSRITALESQVAALVTPKTPGILGLTAEKLDTQYSDDYNIVRTGTPTRSKE